MSKPASKSPRAEDARLTEIGIDSLMAVELRGALAETFGAELPPLSIGETTTVSDMAGTILKALGKIGKQVSDIDLYEINEAFAAVGIASMAHLGISDEIVNVNGGAIALGHPIGMSGNRLALTLAHELRRRGGGIGAAALCGGGGQGDALIIRSVA